jgi:hypothetical protein
MISRISILTTLLCILIVGCKKDQPTQPTNSIDQPNLITNGSFESNGIPTMQGWNMIWPPDSSQLRHIRYSTDIPPNGGAWSIVVDSLYKSRIRLATYVDLPQVNHKYKLSFWAMAQNLSTDVSLMVTGKGWLVSSGKFVAVTDSVWKKYTITSEYLDSAYQEVPDSIRVFQIMLSIDYNPINYGKANFDLIKLEQTD